MDKNKKIIVLNSLNQVMDSGKVGAFLSDTEEEIINDLKLRILENRYELKIESIVDRILWYGGHMFRMSELKHQNQNEDIDFDARPEFAL